MEPIDANTNVPNNRLDAILRDGMLFTQSERESDNYIWFFTVLFTDEFNYNQVGIEEGTSTLILDLAKLIVDDLRNYLLHSRLTQTPIQLAAGETYFRYEDGAAIIWDETDFLKENEGNEELIHLLTTDATPSDILMAARGLHIHCTYIGEMVLYSDGNVTHFDIRPYLRCVITTKEACQTVSDLFKKHHYHIPVYCRPNLVDPGDDLLGHVDDLCNKGQDITSLLLEHGLDPTGLTFKQQCALLYEYLTFSKSGRF